MSQAIENNWKPRKENILRFSTGNACIVKNPGPELALKTAHLNRRLQALRKASVNEQGRPLAEMSEEEKEQAGLDALETMTEEQKSVSYELMCVTVAACVKFPRIYVNPKPGQTGVNDIDETEFLAVYKWHEAGCPDIPEQGEEEVPEKVSAADANRFLAEQGGGEGVGDSGGDIRPEAVAVGGDH